MSDSLKDYATSTVGTAIQRIKNPAFGAFSLSWCAFNWKQLLYLFLSNTSVLGKIEYISTHSTWKTVVGYPILSSIIICGFVPWANLMISKWQVKPLDNTDSINNQREAKLLRRSTRLQRLAAKRDITYQKVTTGEEKAIQDMKEEIIKSKESMGELTAELTAKDEQLKKYSNSLILERKLSDDMKKNFNQLTSDFNELENKYNSLKSEYDTLLASNTEQQLTSLTGLNIDNVNHGIGLSSGHRLSGDNLSAEEEKFYAGVKSVTGWGKK